MRLPDGRTLVTERPGRVRVIAANGSLRAAPAYADAAAAKFLGMAADPAYAANRYVYLYVSYGPGANPNANRVIRLTDDGTNLVNATDDLPGRDPQRRQPRRRPDRVRARRHAVRDHRRRPRSLPAAEPGLAERQDPAHDLGRRPAPRRQPVPGRGRRRYVWSYGHRHPQGIGWDFQGRMWESEHGPSGEAYAGQGGSATGNDEINRIDRGANYGWPTIVGDQTAPGMRNPEAHASSSPAWAPGGLAFGPDRVMYVPFLAGRELRAFTTSGDTSPARPRSFPAPSAGCARRPRMGRTCG